MDPLTAIGAVASIVQLAQTALSLSKTLYTLGAAVSSSSEDIQVLAQDLKTFSQSLTILSRLLEDSKSWYSDDVYLLTARIIRDCAELYAKIDKILAKLGSNGKSTWKVRVKFVYKEGQIKKLMKQLRDMKGTLATILMSLQVDLQLSLLNISSSSKIQRPAEKSLEPETLKTLREAQKSVAALDILSRYSEEPGDIFYERTASDLGPNLPPHQRTVNAAREPTSVSITGHSTSRNVNPDGRTCSNVFNITQSFVLLPSAAQTACSQAPEEDNVSSKVSKVNVTSSVGLRSIKSSSSTESFKSAISLQEVDLEVARQVKAIQSLMHAFRTALQVLHSLIEKRMPSKIGQAYLSAKGLQDSLRTRSKEINDKHIEKFKEHGIPYIEEFTATPVAAHFQEFSSTIMREVVMKLHELSAEHVDLPQSAFDTLCERSELYSHLILLHLDQLAASKESSEEDIRDETARLDESTDHRNLANHQRDDGSGLSLPWFGYTFKRFDNYNQARTPPVVPTSRDWVQTTECFVPPSQLSSSQQARVLQDYQMSLLVLDHQNKSRTMQVRQTSGTTKDPESASPVPFNSDSSGSVISQWQSSTSETIETGSVTEASRPKPKEQMSSDGDLLLHPCSEQDILQNFDFDSFLFQDEEASKFRLPPVTGPSNLPASDTPYTPVHSSFCFPAAEDPPMYINAKQFHRILRRRTARRVLEEESAARDTRLLLSKRRHEEEGKTPGRKESTTQSSDSKSSPIPMQVRAPGSKTKLQLADPKRMRNPEASARFRARRREKEMKAAEKAIAEKKDGSKGSNESPPGPSSPDPSFTLSPAEVEKPQAEPLPPPSIDPSTCLSPAVLSYSPSTKPSLRLDACFSLSALQEDKLWWRSYVSLRLSNFPAFEILCFGIFDELGTLTSCTSHDETTCRQISADFKRYDEINLSYRQKEKGLGNILEMRSNVLRIVKAIDEQLGLQVATLGWSCVCVFLRVYECILTKDSISQGTIEVTNKAFAQLQDLVAIIARYSVLENLYQQSGSALSLKHEYRSALVSLCTTILEYFALSFKLGRAIAGSDSMTGEMQRLINACGQLIETVRDKDMACQNFRVVVVAKMESDSESEGEVEDVSDDSWEEVGISSSEHELIDLDAAIV